MDVLEISTIGKKANLLLERNNGSELRFELFS